MKKFLIAVLVLACTGVHANLDVQAANATTTSCAAIRVLFPRGIAISKAKAKKTRATVSRRLYRTYRVLDTNKNGIACERREKPVPTQTPSGNQTTSPPATTTPPPPAVGSTRDNPHPFGTAVTRSDRWVIQIVSTIPDATSLVLDENMFNDPPDSGGQFFIARVRATYVGAGSDTFSGSFRLRSVGTAGNSYTTFTDSCGVIPDPISNNRTFTNGVIEGNICWAVSSVDAASLVMYDDGFTSDGLVFFALR
jgi:hypothetical protein